MLNTVLWLLWLFVILLHLTIVLRLSMSEAMSDEDAAYLLMTGEIPGEGSLEGVTQEAWLISLEEDWARREEAMAHLKASGLGATQTFIAKRSEKGGIHGCMDSHQRVVRAAYERGVKTLTVFEDDVRLGAVIPKTLKAEIGSILESDEPKVVFMGHLVDPLMPVMRNEATPHVRRVTGRVWLAHAYCMNRPAMEVIMGWENTGKTHYDHFLAVDKALGRFAVMPMIFHQCNCGTSVTAANALFQRYMGWPRAMRLCSNSAERPWLLWLAGGLSVATYAAAGYFILKRCLPS